LNASITFLMLVLLIPRVFFFITIDAIGLPQHIADLTYTATMILLPWPAAIGIRRFYQGILIGNHATRRVAYGTFIRLLSMVVTAVILYHIPGIPGVYIGAAALSAGVVAEAICTRIMVHSILKRLKKLNKLKELKELKELKDEPGRSGRTPLGFIQISRFYYPLALTSMLSLGVHPLVTFFVGKSAMAIESLAVLPVVGSFVFLFRGVGISFQEVAITLLGKNPADDRIISRFATILGLGLATGLVVVAFTPLSGVWFIQVSGLSPALAGLAVTPVMIMGIFPALTVLLSFQRALLVQRDRTGPITVATAIEVIVILSILYLEIMQFQAIGVNAAVMAFLGGRVAANVYLHFQLRRLSA
jgi:hypothetical protein